MLKEKTKTVLLLLIIISNKRPARAELRRILQSWNQPQNLNYLSLKHTRPRLNIRTEDNEN